jgi:hypothetical protein
MGGIHGIHRSTRYEILVGKPERKMAEYKNGS